MQAARDAPFLSRRCVTATAKSSWMKTLGMVVGGGGRKNLRGFYGTCTCVRPRILVGSALDYVPNAGALRRDSWESCCQSRWR